MAGVPIYQTGIAPEWIDYNGHLRDAYYGLILSYAIDAFMDHLGMDAPYRERTQDTLYTLEMHIHYLHEVKQSDVISVAVRVIAADHKRIHAAFDLTSTRHPDPVATTEVMLLHVHQGETVSSQPFPPAISEAVNALRESSASAPASEPGSRRIELRSR